MYNNVGSHIKFKSNVFNQLVRKQQFDKLDFLSFVGGILGLFAGFSALSFIELIYWFTIRAFIENLDKNSTKVYPFTKEFEVESKFDKIKKSLSSYFSNSSIHGLSHIFGHSRINRYSIIKSTSVSE